MTNISTYSLRLIKENGSRYDLDDFSVTSPKACKEVFNKVFELDTRAEEVFALMTLNTKNKITGMFIVSVGAVDTAIVHPREVYKRALLQNASRIIVAHNHPSGSVSPSKEDITLTTRLKEAGDLIGIQFLDHLIIGENNHYSMKQEGVI